MSDRKSASAWVASLLRAHGIQLHPMGPGEVGIMNAPAKWVGIVSDMSAGLDAALNGEPLPELRKKKTNV